jgi:hypothetical protein
VGAVLSAFAAKTVALRLDPDVDTTAVMMIAFAAAIVVSTATIFGLRLGQLRRRLFPVPPRLEPDSVPARNRVDNSLMVFHYGATIIVGMTSTNLEDAGAASHE